MARRSRPVRWCGFPTHASRSDGVPSRDGGSCSRGCGVRMAGGHSGRAPGDCLGSAGARGRRGRSLRGRRANLSPASGPMFLDSRAADAGLRALQRTLRGCRIRGAACARLGRPRLQSEGQARRVCRGAADADHVEPRDGRPRASLERCPLRRGPPTWIGRGLARAFDGVSRGGAPSRRSLRSPRSQSPFGLGGLCGLRDEPVGRESAG
jgi:hypothetical protein